LSLWNDANAFAAAAYVISNAINKVGLGIVVGRMAPAEYDDTAIRHARDRRIECHFIDIGGDTATE
jgi:hypothetical protein